MTNDDLEKRMRIYETAHDLRVLPGMWMVTRIDGHRFTRLTKDLHPFEAPYDERFFGYMMQTARHLMDCGFRVIYGYTQSDEVNLVMHPREDAFGRRPRKYLSLLASNATATFSLAFGQPGVFDCRLSQFPNLELVVDYLRWRQNDCTRNCLNAHVYWHLRKQGLDATAAGNEVDGMSAAAKHELLFSQAGINFNELPNWQKKGVGLYWGTEERHGVNPRTGEATVGHRRCLIENDDLATGDAYGAWVKRLIEEAV